MFVLIFILQLCKYIYSLEEFFLVENIEFFMGVFKSSVNKNTVIFFFSTNISIMQIIVLANNQTLFKGNDESGYPFLLADFCVNVNVFSLYTYITILM